MSNIKSQVVTGIKWSLFAKFAAQVFSWIVTFVVIRILQPEDYGIIEIATAMISLGIALGVSGFSDVLVQKKEHDDRLCAQVLTIAVAFNTMLFLVLFLSAESFAQWYDTPELSQVIKVLSVNILLVSLTVVPAGMLKRDMNFKRLSIIQLIQAATNSIVTLILALLGYAYWSIAMGSLCATIMFALLLNFVTRAPLKLTVSFVGFKEYFKFGFYTITNRVLNFIFQKSDSLIIGKVLGVSPLGLYSAGSQLANLPLEKVAQSLNQVSFVGYAKVKDDPKAIAHYYLQSSKMLAVMVFPVFWGMASIAEPLISLFLGEKWVGAAVVFQMLALVMPFRIYQLATHSAVAGIGHPKFNTKNLIALCVVIPLSILIGLKWGLAGAATGWSCGYLCFFVWMTHRTMKFLGVVYTDFIKSLWLPCMAAGFMLLVNMALASYLSQLSLFIQLCSLIIVGAFVYLLIIFIFERARLIQLLSLFR